MSDHKDDDARGGAEPQGGGLSIQHTIEFIVRQQAQFTADMQRMREAQAEADEKWERRWGRTEEGIRALLAIAEIHEREIEALKDTAAANSKDIAALKDAVDADREVGRATDERLNALINFVERMISERRNGGGADQNEAQ